MSEDPITNPAMIDLERLLRIPLVDIDHEFDISPDGTRLAYSSNITGQWEIFEMDLGASDGPKHVSLGPGGKLAPKYSPDGTHLAYVVDFDGGENFHIFVQESSMIALHSPRKNATDLTPDITFAIQPNFCFSPSGEQIAFLTDITGCFGTYVMPTRGGKASLLLENGFPAWDVDWSPDGRHLAVMNEGNGQDYLTHIIPLDNGEPFAIADKGGPTNAHDPDWSPDGTRLAFHSDAPNGFHQIGIYELGTKNISWLTDGLANHRAPKWSKDGTKLTYIHAEGASDKIVVREFEGVTREFQIGTGVHYKPHFTPDGKSIVFAFSNPRHPPALWMLTLESGECQQLTHSLHTEMLDVSLSMPKEITFPGLDGTPIPALLFKTEKSESNSPAVIMIHGGPNWHFQMEWYPLMIHLASRGLTVLAPNYRGSTGYGRDWQYASRFDLGGVDTDDIAAGGLYLVDSGIADPKKIAVTGESHGGYLTMCCLTRYPDLWCAGSAVVPFLNWFTGHENSREDLQHWDIQNFGDPVRDHDRWYERSPFFFLDRVTALVQMICGENDPRCPASESIQARDRLRELGREVDFVLYKGEGHGFLKTDNLVNAELRRASFLAERLS